MSDNGCVQLGLLADDRVERVRSLMVRSDEILNDAINIHSSGMPIVGKVILFSGGNDSTVLAHLMRGIATHAAHANTTIGIEATREFVRRTCLEWDLPLLERAAPVSYADLVRERGFPGPAQHFKMYQRLKERGLNTVRRELVSNGRKERVVFLAGRRRSESRRRIDVPLHERVGSTIWVSPIAEWTSADMNTYRMMHPDVPRNVVSDLLHMSGECLCGAFAKPSEFGEIEAWFPSVAAEITALEDEIRDRDDIPEHRRKWGWGADSKLSRSIKSGRLCSSCHASQLLLIKDAA